MNSIRMQQCQSIIRKACIAVGLLAGGAYKDNVYATDYEIRKVQIRMLMKIGQVFGREISKRDAKLELKKYGIYVHSMDIPILGNIADANANIFATRLIGKQFVRKLQIQMGKERHLRSKMLHFQIIHIVIEDKKCILEEEKY